MDKKLASKNYKNKKFGCKSLDPNFFLFNIFLK